MNHASDYGESFIKKSNLVLSTTQVFENFIGDTQ